MNIPSYSSQDNNSNNMNKKKVTIIVGVVIAAIVIIGVVIAAILLGSSNNSINQPINTDNTEDSEVYTPEFEPDGPEIEVDESPILDVPPPAPLAQPA